MTKLFFLLLIFAVSTASGCNTNQSASSASDSITAAKVSEPVPGAARMDLYLKLLDGKKVGLVVNHTSLVKSAHLVDTLISKKVNVTKIFAPEHGFRGTAEAGETVKNDIDVKTGLPIVSLYGKNKKPTPEQIKDLDILIFDIQDVGARFYTYISTMHYVMEAAAENNKEVLILDRPNPNGYYIDGPVLKPEHSSFIGMHPIPVVHGLTVGELAGMINGENWLNNGVKCKLTVIKTEGYSHKDTYPLPVKPSPNLPNALAVKLYPSLCLFEGTCISVARGTLFPFQAIGYNDPSFGSFTFTPVSIEGMAKNPPLENKLCYGIDFRAIKDIPDFTLKYLIDYYNIAKDKSTFFSSFFTKLAGNEILRTQIEQGMSEEEIRKTWQSELNRYKQMRKKYLLYPDFE